MGTSEPQKENDLGIIFNNSEKKSDVGTERSLKHDARASHLSNQSDVFDVSKAFTNNHGETGTIVSDRRHTRPSLGESFSSAFKEWWWRAERNISRSKALVKKINDEPLTVAKAETRTEIVREAAQEGHLAPKDDHHVVLEKIRTFKGDSERVTGAPTLTIKDSQHTETKGVWAHTLDEKPIEDTKEKVSFRATPLPDVRTATVAPIVERRIKKDIHDYEKREQKPVRVVKNDIVRNIRNEQIGYMHIPDMVEQKQDAVPQATVRIAPSVKEGAGSVTNTNTVPQRPTFRPARETVREVPTPPPERPLEIVREPVEPSQEKLHTPASTSPEPIVREHTAYEFHGVPKEIPTQEEGPTTITSSTSRRERVAQPSARPQYTIMTWAIFGGICIVGATLAVILSIYFNVFEETKKGEGDIISVPTFFEIGNQQELPLDTNPRVILNAFSERIMSAENGMTQFYPTIVGDGVSRSATSKEFFTFLDTHLGASTIRSLDDTFMVGSITTSKHEPFIVIRSYNFDALFAGLLSWEGYMYTDLAPLFGTEHITSQIFEDSVHNNLSVRILYDDAGRETLLYSFINQNTVVITRSYEALSEIIKKF